MQTIVETDTDVLEFQFRTERKKRVLLALWITFFMIVAFVTIPRMSVALYGIFVIQIMFDKFGTREISVNRKERSVARAYWFFFKMNRQATRAGDSDSVAIVPKYTSWNKYFYVAAIRNDSADFMLQTFSKETDAQQFAEKVAAFLNLTIVIDPPMPPKFQMHLSTMVVLMFVAGPLIGLFLRAQEHFESPFLVIIFGIFVLLTVAEVLEKRIRERPKQSRAK